jgi:hypothetical protein
MQSGSVLRRRYVRVRDSPSGINVVSEVGLATRSAVQALKSGHVPPPARVDLSDRGW